MILLLGASGMIGRAFASELRRRGHSFIPLTRRAFDYTRFDFLFDYVRTIKPVFLINAANYSGNVLDPTGPGEREKMMAANAILPQMIARVCLMTRTPWGHISSGSIYRGAKLVAGNTVVVEPDLNDPECIDRFERRPEEFIGFNEADQPNFTFQSPSCSFYSGSKALAEEAIREVGQSYIWRLRLPFNERNESRNWLWQWQQKDEAHDHIDSFSQVDDAARACLEMWERRAPFGVYHVTNPGALTTRQIADGMRDVLKRGPRVLPGNLETDADDPQSHCILDTAKLLKIGVKMRPISVAIEETLEKMRPAAAVSRRPVDFPFPLTRLAVG